VQFPLPALLYSPDGQLVQPASPVLLKVPAGQFGGVTVVSEQSLPASHSMQASTPPRL